MLGGVVILLPAPLRSLANPIRPPFNTPGEWDHSSSLEIVVLFYSERVMFTWIEDEGDSDMVTGKVTYVSDFFVLVSEESGRRTW